MNHIMNTLRNIGYSLRQGVVVITALLVGLQLVMAVPVLAATSVFDVPNITADPNNWVADEAEVLSSFAERTINKTLSDVAQQTGNEIRMVAVRGLNYGVTPQDFADQLFEEWFPAEFQGNQALLLLDVKTKDAAIRVGQQTKDVIPNELAQSLALESLLIPVRQGNYNQAFQDTATRIETVLSGKADPGPPVIEIAQLPERNYKTSGETNDYNAAIIVVVLLVVATIVPMVTYFMYLK